MESASNAFNTVKCVLLALILVLMTLIYGQLVEINGKVRTPSPQQPRPVAEDTSPMVHGQGTVIQGERLVL